MQLLGDGEGPLNCRSKLYAVIHILILTATYIVQLPRSCVGCFGAWGG